MDKFTILKGVAAPLRMINVDTDIIIPKQFLKTVKRTASILITGENFGCGSSREHAPWAILDMGIKCVIAPSFADIFFNNSFKNGILPIVLPQDQIDELMDQAEENPDGEFTIDLENQTILRGNKIALNFDVDAHRKHCLLNGLDDIGLTLEKKNFIADYEAMDKQKRSWLYS